jgi:high-affinity nickel-transport protein
VGGIDGNVSKLMADGKRPLSVGFWFALGHSTVVVLLVAGIAAGARLTTTLTNDDSRARQSLGVVSTLACGSFLYLIAALNLMALAWI